MGPREPPPLGCCEAVKKAQKSRATPRHPLLIPLQAMRRHTPSDRPPEGVKQLEPPLGGAARQPPRARADPPPAHPCWPVRTPR